MQATDDACTVSAPTAPSGNLTFSVTNGGSKVTEFYLLGADGLRIVGEVENIGPGLSRDLVLRRRAGHLLHRLQARHGRRRHPRAVFAVTDSGEDLTPKGDDKALVDQANKNYQAYVKDQTEQLVTKTEEFAALYSPASRTTRRAPSIRWPGCTGSGSRPSPSRSVTSTRRWTLREADLEPGQKWTGWHRIEKDLWPERAKNYKPLDRGRAQKFADDLVANTNTLYDADPEPDLHRRPDRQRLQGPARRGRDRQGDRRGGVLVADRPVGLPGQRRRCPGRLRRSAAAAAEAGRAELDTQIDSRFVALQKLLDAQREGDGFVLYNELTAEEVKELSDAVNALSEPLSKLTAAVV